MVRGGESARSWWALIVPVADASHEERLVGRFDGASLGAELRDAACGRELVTYFDSREAAQAFAARNNINPEHVIAGNGTTQFRDQVQTDNFPR